MPVICSLLFPKPNHRDTQNCQTKRTTDREQVQTMPGSPPHLKASGLVKLTSADHAVVVCAHSVCCCPAQCAFLQSFSIGLGCFISFAQWDNSSYRRYSMGPLCLWQCLVQQNGDQQKLEALKRYRRWVDLQPCAPVKATAPLCWSHACCNISLPVHQSCCLQHWLSYKCCHIPPYQYCNSPIMQDATLC